MICEAFGLGAGVALAGLMGVIAALGGHDHTAILLMAGGLVGTGGYTAIKGLRS